MRFAPDKRQVLAVLTHNRTTEYCFKLLEEEQEIPARLQEAIVELVELFDFAQAKVMKSVDAVILVLLLALPRSVECI